MLHLGDPCDITPAFCPRYFSSGAARFFVSVVTAWICERGLGTPCNNGTDCNSTFCWNGTGPDNCSECEDNGDCQAGNCGYDAQVATRPAAEGG